MKNLSQSAFVASLAVAATLLLSPAVQASQAAPAPPTGVAAAPPADLVQTKVFGTIRRDNATGKWLALNDAMHLSHGIASVENYRNKALKITFETPALFVGSFTATPDETLAKANVRMGTSVGLTHAYLYMYQGTSKVPVNPNTITATSANIWIDVTHWAAPLPSPAQP